MSVHATNAPDYLLRLITNLLYIEPKQVLYSSPLLDVKKTHLNPARQSGSNIEHCVFRTTSVTIGVVL